MECYLILQTREERLFAFDCMGVHKCGGTGVLPPFPNGFMMSGEGILSAEKGGIPLGGLDPPRTPLGSSQRSPDSLAGGKLLPQLNPVLGLGLSTSILGPSVLAPQ